MNVNACALLIALLNEPFSARVWRVMQVRQVGQLQVFQYGRLDWKGPVVSLGVCL